MCTFFHWHLAKLFDIRVQNKNCNYRRSQCLNFEKNKVYRVKNWLSYQGIIITINYNIKLIFFFFIFPCVHLIKIWKISLSILFKTHGERTPFCKYPISEARLYPKFSFFTLLFSQHHCYHYYCCCYSFLLFRHCFLLLNYVLVVHILYDCHETRQLLLHLLVKLDLDHWEVIVLLPVCWWYYI